MRNFHVPYKQETEKYSGT